MVKRIDNGRTFLIVFHSKAFASGKLSGNIFGNFLLKNNEITQITADTTHWNQVTKSVASSFTLEPLNSSLLTNTVRMEITLKSVKSLETLHYVSNHREQHFFYQYAATTDTIRKYFVNKLSFVVSSKVYIVVQLFPILL